MCQYFDWELNVEPSMLKEFEAMVRKSSTHTTSLCAPRRGAVLIYTICWEPAGYGMQGLRRPWTVPHLRPHDNLETCCHISESIPSHRS